MSEQKLGAAITGDIIASQALDDASREALPGAMRRAAEAVAEDNPGWLEGELEIFRGESWQVYCPSVETALLAGIALRGQIRLESTADTRIAIGYGSIDKIVPEKISLSQGEAFLKSGRALDAMPSDRTLALSLGRDFSNLQPFADSMGLLLDVIITSWTDKQAYAAALATGAKLQTELVNRFSPSITKQAFGKRLSAARWDLVKAAIHSFSNALTHVQN